MFDLDRFIADRDAALHLAAPDVLARLGEPTRAGIFAPHRSPRPTGAIHVHGVDFFTQERGEWDPEALTERPCDTAKARQLFEDSNRALAA